MSKLLSRKGRWLSGGAIVLAGMIALVLVRTNAPQAPPEFLQAQRTASFTLYYPQTLPTGFSLDRKSISSGSHAVLYSCTYNKHQKVSISIQARGPGFTTDSFRPTNEFTTRIGRAYLVDLEDRTTAAVVGPDSWVLINAPNSIPAGDMERLIDSLRSVKSG